MAKHTTYWFKTFGRWWPYQLGLPLPTHWKGYIFIFAIAGWFFGFWKWAQYLHTTPNPESAAFCYLAIGFGVLASLLTFAARTEPD